MTYQELQDLLTATMHRTDLAALVPGFTDRARLRINTDLRTVEQERVASLVVVDNVATLPEDCLEIRHVSSHGRPLRSVGLYEVDHWWRSPRGRVYALNGSELIAPGADEVELAYIGAEPEFLAPGEQRATLTAYPHVWLAASMVEYALHARDQALLDGWVAQYQAGVEGANSRSRRRRSSAAPGLVLSDAVVSWPEARN